MTILHGDNRIYNNIFVQKWPSAEQLVKSDMKEDVTFSDNREVGTAVMDIYPLYEEWIQRFDMESETPDMGKLDRHHHEGLPVWIDGNVYLKGAKAYKNEVHKLIDASDDVYVDVAIKDGKPVLKTNIYQYIKDFNVQMISTGTLGEAFEPEQPFENPDGTPITFDLDYRGDRRSVNILPGPFVNEGTCFDKLFRDLDV